MRLRIGGLGGLAVALLAAVFAADAAGQGATPKPTWVYAHDVRVRKGGTKDFDKDTPKVGVEFFRDDAGKAIVGVTQTGSLLVLPELDLGKDKKATWLFAHDLRVRKGDEDKFTKDTPLVGVEAFKDGPSGKLLYVNEKGAAAIADLPGQVGSDKDPKWHHALILKVRGPNEESFSKDTKKYGVEVFQDGNTGGLIYVDETGAIGVLPTAPATAPDPEKVKAPKALYGMSLRIRKAGEADFGPNTKKLGVEVFQDENTGALIYISETGAMAIVPSPAQLLAGKGVTWKHAMELKARPGGEADFKKAATFGIEVFQDNNTNYLVYASDNGSIAVLPRK